MELVGGRDGGRSVGHLAPAMPCYRYYGMWQPSAALRALFAVIAPSTSSHSSSRTRRTLRHGHGCRNGLRRSGAATRHHHHRHNHQRPAGNSPIPSIEQNLLRCHCRRNDKRTFIKFLISDFIVD